MSIDFFKILKKLKKFFHAHFGNLIHSVPFKFPAEPEFYRRFVFEHSDEKFIPPRGNSPQIKHNRFGSFAFAEPQAVIGVFFIKDIFSVFAFQLNPEIKYVICF